MKITIGHLYPDLLNLYGDRGNIQCLMKRCLWRGIEAETIAFELGDKIDFSKLDIVLLGGGSDREQMLVCEKLKEIQKDFNELYPNVTIYYSADSSGTLQTQIEEGARCDLFFSAADKQMDALTEEKLTKEKLKQFHDDVLEGYLAVMSGDRNTLFKMKELWAYLGKQFVEPEKYLKKIKKVTSVAEYRVIADTIFDELKFVVAY